MHLKSRIHEGLRPRTLMILTVYALAALALRAWMPPRPSVSIALPEPGRPVAFSRDGSALVTRSTDSNETNTTKLRVWGRRTGQAHAGFTVHGRVRDVAVAPDGSLVAVVVGTEAP